MNYEERDTFGIYGAVPTAIDDTVPQRNRGPGPHLMGADTLLGNDVVNTQDEDLGDIKEIMLDMRTGQVSYAVLSFGGFLGMGEKLFAVPWAALKLDTVNKNFVLDASKDRLEKAPGFDQDNWPDMADTAWEKGVHDFYGTQPYVGPRGL